MPKFEYDDVFISVSESRTLYALDGKQPHLEREACIQRWKDGKSVSVAVYRNISETSVFRLVRLQDKLTEQRQVEITTNEGDEDEIPF